MIRFFVLLLALSPAWAARLEFDPAASQISFSVPSTLHTVHGAFRLRRGVIDYDAKTGSASGEIVVDVASGDTGNGSRDKRMHSVVLESSRHPEAVFRINKVEGQKAVTVHGTLTIHGAPHEISVPMEVSTVNGKTTANGTFSVPYTTWGMKDASQFLLKVTPTVEVTVSLVTIQP